MHWLLDTHIVLWWLNNDCLLSKKARSYIQNAEQIYVSSAAIWEMAIKIHVGKLEADLDAIIDAIQEQGFINLDINFAHSAYVSKLPHYHRDPFDRMMIAQAMVEPLRFLTADKALKPYTELVELME
jgi:PIN domain nuclease of toxin-antitoxin system